MENNYGTVRVFDIVLENKDEVAPEYVDLENVDLSADVNSEIAERLDTEEDLRAKSFNWEIREPGAEERETLDEIRKVLARYFEEHSNGTKSKTYESWLSAQDAIDEIADLIGDY